MFWEIYLYFCSFPEGLWKLISVICYIICIREVIVVFLQVTGRVFYPLPLASQEVTDRVHEFAKQMHITRPITVKTKEPPSEVNGCNLWGCSVVIYLEEKPDDFVIAHELAHVKRNHLLILAIVGSMVIFHVFTYLSTYLSIISLWLSIHIAKCWCERDADILCAKYIDKCELADASNYFYSRSHIISNSSGLRWVYNKLITIDPHPSELNRALFFEREMMKRPGILPLDVYVKHDTLNELEVSDDDIRIIRNIIRKSPKRGSFVNLRRIVYKPLCKRRQLEMWSNKGPMLYNVPEMCGTDVRTIKELVACVVKKPYFTQTICTVDPEKFEDWKDTAIKDNPNIVFTIEVLEDSCWKEDYKNKIVVLAEETF